MQSNQVQITPTPLCNLTLTGFGEEEQKKLEMDFHIQFIQLSRNELNRERERASAREI